MASVGSPPALESSGAQENRWRSARKYLNCYRRSGVPLFSGEVANGIGCRRDVAPGLREAVHGQQQTTQESLRLARESCSLRSSRASKLKSNRSGQNRHAMQTSRARAERTLLRLAPKQQFVDRERRSRDPSIVSRGPDPSGP